MPDLLQVCRRLNELSEREYVNPYSYIAWPESLDLGQWFMSPELISIYGTDTFESMTEEEQKRLSFFEAVNFFSLNINGERPLVAGLSQRVYRVDPPVVTEYLHHFLDEENKHMTYFGTFCLRYAGKVYPDKKMTIEQSYAPGEEDFLFFTKVMVFEALVDVYNRAMARDERLHPIVRKINRIHHVEEARHLAFGQFLVKTLFESHAPHWSRETLANLRRYLIDYLESTWREYYNPQAYRDAGLSNAFELRQRGFQSDHARGLRARVQSKCLGYLRKYGILEGDPS